MAENTLSVNNYRSQWGILMEISKERDRQDDKWGQLNYPSVNPKFDPDRDPPRHICSEYGIPEPSVAQYNCDTAFQQNRCHWAHIAIEELSESVGAPTEKERRKELIQAAAVLVNWIECMDRRANASEAKDA